MITEKWDIFDENGNLTGKKIVRGMNFLKRGEFHLVVHIWIISSDDKILVQRRADNKKLMPGEWAATGGAAISGEDSFTAAKRELFEELGIKSDENSLKKLFRIKRKNSFLDVWCIETDADISDLTLQESEVAEAKWVTKDELLYMIENEIYHNYGNEYFSKVFEKIETIKGVTK